MADSLSPKRRSENMRRIRSRGMKPERIVRRLITALGYRYRLEAKELPGKPDIVRRPQKQAIFVHGCFWHQHRAARCLDGRPPKSNTGYWLPKLAGNVARDRRALAALKRAGWRTLVVWECETKNEERLTRRLAAFFSTPLAA